MSDMQSLQLVRAARDIARSHATFVGEMAQAREIALDLIRRTRYWVYEPTNGSFSPSKFAGYVAMDFQRYDAAREEGSDGDKFDGGLTQRAVAAVLGDYRVDGALSAALAAWVTSHFGAHALDGIARTKWRFVRLAPTSAGLVSLAGGWEGSDELADALDGIVRTPGRTPPDLDA